MWYRLVFRRYAPFDTFGFGFEGDKRTKPTSDPDATARTIGCVNFQPNNVDPVMLGFSSGSRWFSDSQYSYSKIAKSITVKTKTAEKLSFTAYTAGANPIIPLAPDIDTFVDLDVVFNASSIVFSGRVRGDAFPNAEVWVYDFPTPASTLYDADNALLFDFRTSGGQDSGPLSRLYFSGAKNELGRFMVTVPILPSGAFVKSFETPNPIEGAAPAGVAD